MEVSGPPSEACDSVSSNGTVGEGMLEDGVPLNPGCAIGVGGSKSKAGPLEMPCVKNRYAATPITTEARRIIASVFGFLYQGREAVTGFTSFFGVGEFCCICG